MMKLCPFRVIAMVMAQAGNADAQCIDESCQLWDAGRHDVYEPGCGLVPRENMRVRH